MTSRRGASHVRPRPPSSGRPVQAVKVRAPDSRRVRQHRGLDARRPRAPLVTRTLLAISVVLLAGAAFVVASGGIGAILSSLGAAFDSAVGRITATPVPDSTLPPTDSPRIASPDQPYTNEEMVNLAITVPAEAIGDPAATIRIYLALEGLEPAAVGDWPVGSTSLMVIPFQLEKGRNIISATLVRSTTDESEHSPSVTWILDLNPPKINIQSPEDGEDVETPDALIRGSTQAETTLVARNAANSASISTVAARDGSFEFQLPLVQGDNEIEITATDPAGNQNAKTLTLVQGSTEMRINLRASSYTISVKHHPSSLQLVVVVHDPSGDPIAGATAFFTLQIPGLAPISNELVTGADGRATFTTPLIGELSTGGGVGTVLVTSETYGEKTDRVTLNFVK
jgi:Glucodextranase, domain B